MTGAGRCLHLKVAQVVAGARQTGFFAEPDCFVRNLVTNNSDQVRGREICLRLKPASRELAGEAGGLSYLGRVVGGGRCQCVWFGRRVTARLALARASRGSGPLRSKRLHIQGNNAHRRGSAEGSHQCARQRGSVTRGLSFTRMCSCRCRVTWLRVARDDGPPKARDKGNRFPPG
jgi:hypothetical protein